jgi:hypothetical protein
MPLLWLAVHCIALDCIAANVQASAAPLRLKNARAMPTANTPAEVQPSNDALEASLQQTGINP